MSLISETGVFVVTPDDINNGKSLLHVMYAMPFDIFRTQWIGLRLQSRHGKPAKFAVCHTSCSGKRPKSFCSLSDQLCQPVDAVSNHFGKGKRR